MRVGLFHGRKYYLRNVYTALEALLEDGHELVLTSPESKARSVRVPVALRDHPRVTTALYPNRREDGLEPAVKILRAVRDAVRYELPQLRGAYANRRRAYRKLAAALSAPPVAEPPSLGLPAADLETFDAALSDLEQLVPPNARLVRFIREQRLDAAVSISRVNFGGGDAEVIKAARAAGVPSALIVYSWDNLTSKALIHEHPDRVFVWNEIQVEEAADLHGIDAGRVVATGAPRFDEFFALAPSAPREELLRRLGLDPAAATVLYLGSSGFVTKREPELVERWVAALRASADGRVREANVVVRPHPGTLDEPQWAGWSPSGERVAMPPPRRSPQDLLDTLSLADAVVALNTSAEIEAAIAGRPVLTIEVGGLAPGQEGSAHFRYLLAGEGGFVETATDLDEHLAQLRRALAEDPFAGARQRFLESFVRPRGLDRPAGRELAAEIEALAVHAFVQGR